MDLFSTQNAPLSDRARPASLDQVMGQEHLVGDGQFLRTMIEHGKPTSLILWGPPGSGKTTLARIIAKSGDFAFEELSAVTSGLPEVKKVIDRAKDRHRMGGSTVLFVDEIHRFNKAQQDAFLPHVENGTIILIGATTENPSFEVISPLLSRSRVITLKSLSTEQIIQILRQALEHLPGRKITDEAMKLLANMVAGDARAALNGLETAAEITAGTIEAEHIKQVLQKPSLKYDKGGEYHYNLISAYIKSMRASDPDAALYYLARILESGEDPKFVARRMIIFASEDIGLAQPAALTLATSTFMAIERIGMPEGRIILSQTTIYLATCPKSRAAYNAIARARQAVIEHPELEVPLHLRNAPTKLMKDSGYGQGYKWQPDFNHPKGNLPDELEGTKFYDPS